MTEEDKVIDRNGLELRFCDTCERFIPKDCFCGYCGYCADCCTQHEYEDNQVPEEYDEE